MAFNLYLRAPGERRLPPAAVDAVIHLDEPGLSGYPLHHNLGDLWATPHPPGQEVSAFLLAALGVWAADKLIPRRAAPDAWTRQIGLHLPLSSSWGRLGPRLAELVNFLTGDEWTLKGRKAAIDLGLAGVWPHSWQPQAVVLFSGGLDSLVGAIDLLEAGRRLVLVSHYDFGQLAAAQQTLATALAEYYGAERLHHLTLRVQFPEAPELTLRSRSLLYLALGLAAAAAFGEDTPLVIPENGWVSLNPPLTLNRLGTYSTRTTHPHFLKQLTGLWREVGLDHPLINPYQSLPKGELLAQCRNRNLLKELFPLTTSCARPVASRWRGQPPGECGYCYPCLVRRAALHRLGWDKGEAYLLDALAAPETLGHRTRGRDLKALLIALKTWEESPEEMEARLYLGEPGPDLPPRFAAARQLLAAGFQEITHFFRDKGPTWVRSYADWS